MGLLFATNVNADSTTQTNAESASSQTIQTTNGMSISEEKALISPVGNQGQQTLSQIAQANNVSLSELEELNGNISADAVPDEIYLPQNINYSVLFTSLRVDKSVPKAIYQKYYANLSKQERAAKLWIALKESGYNYDATNGKYYGRFQLNRKWLKGNYSKENQEKVADKYVKSRYGSWVKAKKFHLAHGWY